MKHTTDGKVKPENVMPGHGDRNERKDFMQAIPKRKKQINSTESRNGR